MAETIGLDIGSHSIKLVGIKTTSKGPFLTCVGLKEIPHGTDKEDMNTVIETLRSLVSEVGLKTKKVNLTVSGSGVTIKRVSIPSLPKAELKEAVRWEIKDSIPFSVEKAQIDFHVLNEYVEDNVKKLDMITVACPKELVHRTVSIVKGAGLQPVHLDVGPFALWNALMALDQIKKEETVALIDMGAEKTGIYLFKDRTLQFTREVTPAGADITNAIIEGIGSSGSPELLYERAESIKEEMGIPSEGYQEKGSDPSTSLSKIIFLIRPVMEKMVAEIVRSFEYFRNLFNVEKIDKVLLTGGSANLKNMVPYLSKELRLPVEHFNPMKKILYDSKKIDTPFLNQMGLSFAIAIGMALPEPKRIELLPNQKPFLSEIQIGKWLPVWIPLITLLLFLGIIWYMSSQVNGLQKERDTKMAKIATYEVLQAKLKLLKEKDLQIKEKLSQFPSSMVIPVPYRNILREVSGILPDNVTLTHLSVQPKGKPLKGESTTNEGRELHLSGLTFGSDVHCLTALASMLERLEGSPLFKNVKLISADENKLYSRPGAGFEIICDINPNNPASPPFNPLPLLKGGKEGITKGGLGGLGEEKR
ncbi:MAG: type IV pilus assembly protein PilM [Syntrophaceae bacterium]|nr:type IV pilus assembly protein PilM [Syntrophaceae bacterium]